MAMLTLLPSHFSKRLGGERDIQLLNFILGETGGTKLIGVKSLNCELMLDN